MTRRHHCIAVMARHGSAVLLALAAFTAVVQQPAAGQRIFPQQTGWTFSWTNARGSATSQGARARAGALFPSVIADPGTEIIIGPDGNYDYQIEDPTFKFGSFYQSVTTKDSEVTDRHSFFVITDFGFSIFHNN